MRPADRASARRQLDKRLSVLTDIDALTRPPRGWVKAIREALGMTTAQLAKRMGVSQPRAVTLEQAEARGAITLDSLERAEQALDCRLVYALVPRHSRRRASTSTAAMKSISSNAWSDNSSTNPAPGFGRKRHERSPVRTG